MIFVAYILKCSDNTFYIGSTSDMKKRLHAHNFLKSGAHYTKIRRPVELVYKEEFDSFSDAKKRESGLKKLTRKEKVELVRSKNNIDL